MQKYKKPTFTEEDLGVNPFAQSLKIPVNEIEFKNVYKKEEDMLLPLVKEVEKTPITKLYTTSEHRKFTNNLSLRSKELLLWIMYEVKYGEDFLWVNKKRYMEECNISSLNTYKEAIKELIRYGYVGLTVIQDVYWINPLFFFKGDRIAKYPNNVVKTSLGY